MPSPGVDSRWGPATGSDSARHVNGGRVAKRTYAHQMRKIMINKAPASTKYVFT